MVLSCSGFGLWLPVVAEIGRFSALTMPLVTVFCRPSGDPTATTPSPTRRLADEPSVTGVRPETPRALTTAVAITDRRERQRPQDELTAERGCLRGIAAAVRFHAVHARDRRQ